MMMTMFRESPRNLLMANFLFGNPNRFRNGCQPIAVAAESAEAAVS